MPTGIDRVEMAYARYWLNHDPDRVTFLLRASIGAFVAVPRSLVRDLLVALDTRRLGGPGGLDADKAARSAARTALTRLSLGRGMGDVANVLKPENDIAYLLVSHLGADRPDPIAALKRKGVKFVPLVHDLIPVAFPEYATPAGVRRHTQRVEAFTGLADGMIANSRTTAADIASFLVPGSNMPDIVSAPLGIEWNMPDANLPIPAEPYCVCIGTIEPRKNHLLLLNTWRVLAERLGPDTPKLILIGRRGWENENILDMLDRCQALSGIVREYTNLPDGAVARLLQGARALLFPSFAEGYGLPLAEALLRDIAARLADGTLAPLPYRTFPAEEAEAAFRQLQASSHIGKLVITPPDPSASGAAPWEPDEAGCYVMLGGTQGFGLECAKWLAAAGARRIALISRRGAATPGMDAALRILAALGARASAHACDAADGPALGSILATLRAEGAPIRGVVQAAAVFADGAAARQDQASFARVLAPKLLAAEALEALTADDPLHLFLLFSSATTAFGNPGQANYVAANAALEGLARRRHAAGKPALTVGWGPIADAGVLTREAAAAEKLERLSGAKPMAAQKALAALPALIGAGTPVIHLARMNWAGMQAALPILAEPAFAPLGSHMTARDADGAALRAKLLAMTPEAARAEVLALAREEMARILRLPPEAVRVDQPLPGLGLDSLGGIELRMALERRLGISVPLTAVTEDLTLGILVQRVAGVLFKEDADLATAEALIEAHEPVVAK